jgi:hypothetical protein
MRVSLIPTILRLKGSCMGFINQVTQTSLGGLHEVYEAVKYQVGESIGVAEGTIISP